MSPEKIAALLLGLPEVTEEEPFAPGLPVYKVAGKVFAIYQPDPPAQITLKCDPARALHLRDDYPAIVPGYHVNKRLWNTVSLDDSVPDDLLVDLIRPFIRAGRRGVAQNRPRSSARSARRAGAGLTRRSAA
jgi:predicted DNA-binding protein (MmcQ/YjbR family)